MGPPAPPPPKKTTTQNKNKQTKVNNASFNVLQKTTLYTITTHYKTNEQIKIKTNKEFFRVEQYEVIKIALPAKSINDLLLPYQIK